jgi:hypothetical protein
LFTEKGRVRTQQEGIYQLRKEATDALRGQKSNLAGLWRLLASRTVRK